MYIDHHFTISSGGGLISDCKVVVYVHSSGGGLNWSVVKVQ
jgi:hypothetical protein